MTNIQTVMSWRADYSYIPLEQRFTPEPMPPKALQFFKGQLKKIKQLVNGELYLNTYHEYWLNIVTWALRDCQCLDIGKKLTLTGLKKYKEGLDATCETACKGSKK